jgi:hypothetical protein
VMDTKFTQPANTTTETKPRSSGPLLDLGYFEPTQSTADDDFVLDLDLDGAPEPADAVSAFQGQQFRRSFSGDAAAAGHQPEQVAVVEVESVVTEQSGLGSMEPTVDPMAQTQEMLHPVIEPAVRREAEREFTEPEILEGETLRMPRPMLEPEATGKITLTQLSPEAIDAIARRAVEMLSEKVVQEIAWEVVPQLAELLIKRQLEEKSS